jgi:hypothetical protein
LQLSTFCTVSVLKALGRRGTRDAMGRRARDRDQTQARKRPGPRVRSVPLPRRPPVPSRTLANHCGHPAATRHRSAPPRHAPRLPPRATAPPFIAPHATRATRRVPRPGCRRQIPAPTQIWPAQSAEKTPSEPGQAPVELAWQQCRHDVRTDAGRNSRIRSFVPIRPKTASELIAHGTTGGARSPTPAALAR